MVLARVVTAVVLIPLVLAAVWYGSLPYFLFIVGVCLLSLWEYSLMADEGGYPNQMIVSFVGGLGILLALYLDGVPVGPLHAAPSPIFILVLWIFLSFIREFLRRDKSYSYLRVMSSINGVVLCTLLLGHLLLVRDLKLVKGDGFESIGRELTFFLFIVVWCVDTGAWGVGRMWGLHKMASKISPKKTWEGAIGGTIIACLIGLFFREIFLSESIGRYEALLFAFLIALTAQASDLIESLMKRSFGVKNSSEILPGHGGILDRFDSFLFAAPLFYYVLVGSGRFH